MFAPQGVGGSHGAIVVGIDPGLTRCGFAALEEGPNGIAVVAMGVMSSPSDMDVAERLASLHHDISDLLDETTPRAVAVEKVFFQSNARTAMSVAQASGVVLALASSRGIPVVQYSPSQVKSAVAGSGTADKLAIQRMVQRRLGLTSLPQPPDAADAAAIALCHLAVSPLANAVSSARGVRA